MSTFYDGSGRMRERPFILFRALEATKLGLKMVALIGFVVTYPIWGHFVPRKAH